MAVKRWRVSFDCVEQHAGDVQPELRVQLADAGRAGDVDLGQPVADHVQSHEQHAAALHLRADLGGDPAVALAERAALADAAGGEVAAELVALRHPRQAVVDRLPVHQQDALVALRDLGKVALGHRQLAAAGGQRLQDHVEVRVAQGAAEDRAPAHAVQRLEHRHGAGHHGLGRELGEPHGVGLLADVAQRSRLVDHQHAGFLGALQQEGRVDEFHVEGRILAHQDHVQLVRVGLAHLAELEPALRVVAHLDRAQPHAEPAFQYPQVGLGEVLQRVAAPLRLQQHRQRGVLGRLDAVDGVHHDPEADTGLAHLQTPWLGGAQLYQAKRGAAHGGYRPDMLKRRAVFGVKTSPCEADFKWRTNGGRRRLT
jgi:hypothetical protein